MEQELLEYHNHTASDTGSPLRSGQACHNYSMGKSVAGNLGFEYQGHSAVVDKEE